MGKEETFLEIQPGKDDFFRLLADQFLTPMSGKQRMEKLIEVFLVAAKNYNDEAAKELLIKIEKAHRKLKLEREGDPGKFIDYLMEVYWQLPGMEVRADTVPSTCRYPIMLRTKFRILGEIASGWCPDWTTREITETSIKAFRFLIAVFNPVSRKNWPRQRPGESEFELKARDRIVSQEEREEIIVLIRRQDVRFNPDELEFWMAQPYLPYEFERILAMARVRKGGHDLWRKDIRNAQLLKSLCPDERTEAAIDLHQSYCQIIADLDRKVQKLLGQMKSDGYLGNEEIGSSEYVLGQEEIIYNNPFDIIIKIELKPEHPEALVCDNFGRAKRHIKSWLQNNPSDKVRLSMKGGKTSINLTEDFLGERHHLTKER